MSRGSLGSDIPNVAQNEPAYIPSPGKEPSYFTGSTNYQTGRVKMQVIAKKSAKPAFYGPNLL
jgi:hypothetical protein